ncbi:unnamed protein product [Cuscuta epithymum]|uniref:MI domain-containing protein n=1 Tax=Cuscuta epithymum TaxID=186058 RepID=A0AAV0EP60_9ASTE|nr:unnamed protein product [Cuscuta epithymum]
MANEDNQSRRERRKEARLSKNKKKFDWWIQYHQKSLKHDKTEQGMVVPKNSMDLLQESDSEPDHGINTHEKDNMFSKITVERKPRIKGAKLRSDGDINAAGDLQDSPMATKSHTSGKIGMEKQSSDENVVDANSLSASCNDSNKTHEVVRTKESAKRKRKKSRLEELLDSENGAIPADEDLALEKKLAKKLKVKKGKLKGDDDGFNMLFDDMPSVLELIEDEKLKTAQKGAPKTPDKMLHIKSKSVKSIKQKQVIEGDHKQDQRSVNSTEKASSPPPTSGIGAEPGKLSAQSAIGANAAYIAPHRRSKMGSESQENAQIRRQVQGLLNRLSESNVESITSEMSTIIHTVGRSLGSLIISEAVLTCFRRPHGNEQHAAVFAAFVAGMSCSIGIDFGAKVLASLAKHFEEEYQKEYPKEDDNMSLRNLTLLFSYLYIFGVFSSDLIYDFLVMLSKRLTEADVATILAVLQSCGMKLRADDPIAMMNFITSIQNRVNELKTLSKTKRMYFMVQTICEIKNNKKRPKEETVQLTRIRKWLQKLRVDDILLRGLKWCKLIDPDKKGQWWLSGDVNVNSVQKNVQDVAQSIDMEVLEAKKMLQLAAEQRMNTEGRRAIFCVIMSGVDYIDAFEKLLRLDLPGKQDREIMRVLVECCLQEKAFNKYYCALASKLCSHNKNHKFTLQYCLWDHFKELESMQLMRSMHLSKFVAEMLSSFTLSLSVLKAVDLGDITLLTPKKIMHFRMLFEAIFEFPDELVWNIFSRLASPEYETLCNGIVIFIREYVLSGGKKSLAGKFKIAKKALNNVEGVLM